jgi:hypothetical protein
MTISASAPLSELTTEPATEPVVSRRKSLVRSAQYRSRLHAALADMGQALDMCGGDVGAKAIAAWRALRDATTVEQEQAACAAGIGVADEVDYLNGVSDEHV